MKPFNPGKALLCLLAFIVFFSTRSYSQCSSGAYTSSISYDTTFKGGGNSNYDVNFPQFDTGKVYMSFPQFDPSKGTLVSVNLQTFITVKYSYTLENLDIITLISRIKMIRSDIINSPVLTAPLETDQSKIVAIHILTAAVGLIGAGTDFVASGLQYAYKNTPINYTLNSNLAGFMGNGQVPFDYQTETDLFPSGAKYLWNPTTEDSIYFKLTYNYCTTMLLPADINNFTAVKSASGNLQLSFNSPNDNIGNKYEMQKSTDGKNYASFETIVSKSSTANSYQVIYTPTQDDKGKVFFRIKQFEADGTVKYSIVKTVPLEYVSTTMKVYPTVTKNNINIYFPNAAKADYQVTILTLTGQVMQQTDFSRTNLMNVPLNTSLNAGMYLVSVVNKQTSERQQSKIVIE